MQMGEELETRTIIFPLGRVYEMSAREAAQRQEVELEVEVGAKSWGAGRLEVVLCGHLILAFIGAPLVRKRGREDNGVMGDGMRLRSGGMVIVIVIRTCYDSEAVIT
jgi:hypothetical protein